MSTSICPLNLGFRIPKDKGGERGSGIFPEKGDPGFFRKSVMSAIFPPVILGPEVAAPIFGHLAFFGSFCSKTPMPIKFHSLGGGGGSWLFWKGGWKCQFYFIWAWGFSEFLRDFPQFLLGGAGNPNN